MNIFKRIISKLIKKLNPFGKKEAAQKVPTKKDIQPEISKIEKAQKSEREITATKEDGSSPERVKNLTPKQEKLIEQKVEILDKSKSDKKIRKLKELNSELELLKTNLFLQSRIQFEIKPISQNLIESISKELIPEINFEVSTSEKKDRQTIIAETRKTEQTEINELKSKVTQFSLINIHKEREAIRKEHERLDRERKLDEEYSKHISNSEKELSNKDFKGASNSLRQALKVRPELNEEIQKLLRKIESAEKTYKDKNQKFISLFNLAEKYFHNGELEKAIEFYKEANELNIDNSKCNRRIADAQNKILKLKKRKEEQERKERLERELREKYKSEAKEIVEFYKTNGISQFYHYTDRRNLDSILQNNGLFSLREMNNRGIDYHQGSETYEWPDYVRLSYTQNHPLLYISLREGRIRQEKTLKIKLDVAGLRHTKFTNVNAARTATYPTVESGDDLNFIRDNVKINIVKQRNHFNLSPDEKPYYQAEIMVKDHLPLEYIKNL